MNPVPAPPHVFGLRGGRLRYVRADGDGVDRSLVAYHAVNVEPEVFGDGLLGGPVREVDELRGVVGALLEDVGSEVDAATLVLPEAWFRLLFLESEELPEDDQRRDEVLRWKIKRMVPFRVEDLRLSAAAVDPLPGQEEAGRYLVGFGSESLLGAFEEAFDSHGVHLGRITCESLGTLSGVERGVEAGEVALLVLADETGWSLIVARGGRPVLHRYKPQPEAISPTLRPLVERDLRLTVSFVEEHFAGATPRRVFLLASPELEEPWSGLLETAVGRRAEPVGALHLGLEGAAESALRELAPLVGATWEVVS